MPDAPSAYALGPESARRFAALVQDDGENFLNF